MLNEAPSTSNWQKIIVYLGLTLVTLAVFWQVNQFEFIALDDPVFVENTQVQSGFTLEAVRWAFGNDCANLWAPLTWLSFVFNYHLFGLNAGGYHLTNLILHILSIILLFRILNLMTGAIWKSAFVAALFAFHPLRVESVALVAERKDVLGGFFWMLTLYLYFYYTKKPMIRRYLLVLFSFVCALMSKPIVVTLPAIMILLDYWPLKRFESKKGAWFLWQLKEKTPFFILSLFASLITILIHKQPPGDFPVPLVNRIANVPVYLLIYLKNIFLPANNHLYPFFEQLSVIQFSGAFLFILAISVIVIIMIKSHQYLFVGWLWFIITISPVIEIFHSNASAMGDRYTYLPSIGISIMLAWGIPLLLPQKSLRKKILLPVGIAIPVIFSVLTWQQCKYWKNNATLSSLFLQVTRDNYLPHNNIANAFAKKEEMQNAISYYDRIIRLKPDNAIAYNNRGTYYERLDQSQRAIDDFNQALRLKSDYAYAYSNRGVAYLMQGSLPQYCHDVQIACELGACKMLEYSKVQKHCPIRDNAYGYNKKAIFYAKKGENKLALDNFNKAILLGTYNGNFYVNRAIFYFNQGNKQMGCSDAATACKLGNCNLFEISKEKGYCR